MQRYSRDLYLRLEAETGLATGFRQTGYLQLASNKVRQQVLRRERNFARSRGVDKYEISPAEIKKLFPALHVSDLLSGIYTPDDGRANPVDITMSLAAGARQGGARIFERVGATTIAVKGHRAVAVETAQGRISADHVVLAAGMWSRQLGERIGVSIPLQAAEHYYLLTERVDGIDPTWPVVEDAESYAYIREEGGGYLFGMFEPEGACWNLQHIPESASFLELPPDWERMTPFLHRAFQRLPIMSNIGIKKLFCGPESFTPDGSFLVGESPEVDRLFVATGMNSLGILTGGGMGALVAEWIVSGTPQHDVTGLNVARSMPHESTKVFLGERIPQSLGYLFSHASLPHYKHLTARQLRRTALHQNFATRGAYFAALSGWEAPLWFSQNGVRHTLERNFERQPWFGFNEIEHRGVRESVGLIEKTLMGKFIVQGRDAEFVLNRVSANSVSGPIGRNVYTQWLNERGGIVADLTITRLDESRFLLVTTDTLQRSVCPWLRRHTRDDEFCSVTDVTSAYAILSIQGPKSRDLLQSISGSDLSTAAVPFRSSCYVEIGPVRVLAIRVTYVGELGYELYIPSEYALTAYEAVLTGSARMGSDLLHFGLMTLDSLRLEKGYRDYGVDIDNSDTPLEAGLGFAVDFKKSDFIGRDAILRQRDSGPVKKRLVQFLLRDSAPLLFGREPILVDGRYCGYIRAGGYGHTLGSAVGLGTVEQEDGVTTEFLSKGRFEVEVANERFEAMASLKPLYDATNSRITV